MYVPLYRGDNEFPILGDGNYTFKAVSPRLSEKSRRELKSMYPTTGATTNSQSSEMVIILLRQSPPMEGNIIRSCFELFEMFFEEKNSSNKQFKTASKASIESHGWGAGT